MMRFTIKTQQEIQKQNKKKKQNKTEIEYQDKQKIYSKPINRNTLPKVRPTL